MIKDSKEHDCNNCIWNDLCYDEDKIDINCEHYSPVDEKKEDLYINELIENNRYEYYREWRSFIDTEKEVTFYKIHGTKYFEH